MSRITGHLLTEALGRLVAEADMDSAEKVLTFKAPSTTRENRVYVVEVDLLSCEVACSCEAFSRGESGFREASRMPYRFETSATALEALAKAKGYGLLPLITRAPRNMCPHCRKARRWLQRHGMFGYFEMKEAELLERVQALPDRTKRRSA